MQNCSEACKRGNRCNTINPQSSTFLYSIQDYGPDRDSNGAANSYYGIIEVGVPAHDDDVVTAFYESGAKRSRDNSQIELTRHHLSDIETVEKNFGDTCETVSICWTILEVSLSTYAAHIAYTGCIYAVVK